LVHPQAAHPLAAWNQLTRQAAWRSFPELRATFASAELVGRLTVFNIAGNKYRLIARVEYQLQRVYVRKVLTHDEYNKNKWKDDPWF
jgi:mRNA interferase HigB